MTVTAPLAGPTASTSTDPRKHWYRPPDFPVALCGHVSTQLTLDAARDAADGPICEVCMRLALPMPYA